MTAETLTQGTLQLFLWYAEDAGNWGGTPLVGGNIDATPENNGHLTDLKKKGLITTDTDEGEIWLHFTEQGRALAAAHGFPIE